MVKANLGLSLGHKGIEKKQSLISIIIKFQPRGKAESTGRPLCTGPNKFICSLMALRSWSSLHFPDFFLITKIGVFQGEVEGSIWPNFNCSSTS
ncbi:Uncharacterised protein [Chlamydia trachomatis]|nr:Uncharacterised protein [Chlamydia trachomatis]